MEFPLDLEHRFPRIQREHMKCRRGKGIVKPLITKLICDFLCEYYGSIFLTSMSLINCKNAGVVSCEGMTTVRFSSVRFGSNIGKIKYKTYN